MQAKQANAAGARAKDEATRKEWAPKIAVHLQVPRSAVTLVLARFSTTHGARSQFVAEAIRAGADGIVVGRPLRDAVDLAAAARAIAASVSATA